MMMDEYNIYSVLFSSVALTLFLLCVTTYFHIHTGLKLVMKMKMEGGGA